MRPASAAPIHRTPSCHSHLQKGRPARPPNSPDAQSSSSAPFSQSFSPSHLHDNDTHLLVDPPQSNFSGGHVCLPADGDKIDRGDYCGGFYDHTTLSWTWFLSPPTMQLKLLRYSTTRANWFYSLDASKETWSTIMKYSDAQLAVRQKSCSAPSPSSFSCQSVVFGTG